MCREVRMHKYSYVECVRSGLLLFLLLILLPPEMYCPVYVNIMLIDVYV